MMLTTTPAPSHMKACLTYACQRNILHHEDKRGEKRGGSRITTMNTHTHTRTHTRTSSHCMGQSGSLKKLKALQINDQRKHDECHRSAQFEWQAVTDQFPAKAARQAGVTGQEGI
ncbi:hypothetical protein EYF80_051999 [Liparis tanakae]|uniref:Uncharacterized protein n=1 Tax=Liparis tanakae TaxID=230148 RepID=A0A4Z2F9H0_9TELE|nr:hypothetical protein EYF80_051999 [Liparis tanakae]